MDLSRRTFLDGMGMFLGGTAAIGCASHGASLPALPANAKPRLVLGVMTDTHTGTDWMMGINSPAVLKALRILDGKKVDVVMHCGDMVNTGKVAQIRHFAKLWNEVFPGGKAADGRAVEKVFVTGNHEHTHWIPLEKQDSSYMTPQIKTIWPELFGEEWTPVFAKKVKGFWFVGAHWGENTKEKVEPFLRKAAAETKPGEPVFYTSHAPNARTCLGSWPDDGDGSCGSAGEVLKTIPNAIAISGHSHKPITHPRSIWQGEYTALHAGVVTWSDLKPMCWPNDLPPASPYTKNVIVLRVWTDRITIERIDSMTEEKIGATWTIPLPLQHSSFPYRLDDLLAKASVPVWPDGAKLSVNKSMGENTLFHYPPNRKAVVGEGGVVLTCPAAKVDGDEDMIVYYNLSVTRADDGKEIYSQRLLTDFHLGKEMIRPKNFFIVDAKHLPAGVSCKFHLTPVSAYWKAGATLTSSPIVWRKANPNIE